LKIMLSNLFYVHFCIAGNECCERLAYYGINTNLVTYLTKMLHQGNATAAKNVTIWSGTCYLTPLLGAILADAYWGRYWTIAAFSTIYFMVCLNFADVRSPFLNSKVQMLISFSITTFLMLVYHILY